MVFYVDRCTPLQKTPEEEEESRENAQREAVGWHQRLSRWLIGGGIVGSLLCSLGLLVGFNHGIRKRLDVLVENSRRLAAGQTILPPLSGHDEIA